MKLSKETIEKLWATTDAVTSQHETGRKPVIDRKKEKH